MSYSFRKKKAKISLTADKMEELGLFRNEVSDELEALFEELTDFHGLLDEVSTPAKINKFINKASNIIDEVNEDLNKGGGGFDFGWETRAQPDDTSLSRYRQFEEMFVNLMSARVERVKNGTTQEYYSSLDEARRIKSHIEDVEGGLPKETPKVIQSDESLLSTLWNEWAISKSWSPKIAKEYGRQYEFFIALWGDIDVKRVTKSSIRDALRLYAVMPAGNVKPFNKMTVPERLEYAQEHADSSGSGGYKTVSPKTVQGVLKALQGFFSSFLTKEIDVLTVAPTDGVKYEADDVRRGSFNKTEMKSIVDYVDKESDVGLKWASLIAIHTGMRRGEVLHAMEKGIQRDSDSQLYYFHVTEGKTDNALRKIPVSEHLIKRDIIGINLSINTPDSRVLSRFLQSTLKLLHIPKVDVDGLSRTFHSLRHTFITYARQNESVNLSQLQEVVGHSKAGGLTDRYTHQFNLDKTKPVVDYVRFD